jgi:hypothetical protein
MTLLMIRRFNVWIEENDQSAIQSIPSRLVHANMQMNRIHTGSPRSH